MKIFHAVVHKDEDSAFGLSFPDLPGVFSAADDEADLIAQATEALALYFETEPMIDPMPIERVRAFAKDDLEEGAYILGVPFIEDISRSVKLTISTTVGVQRAIDSYAKQRNMTRSKVLTEAVLREMSGSKMRVWDGKQT
jgi:predicted RNase H-like HicB family nuclease